LGKYTGNNSTAAMAPALSEDEIDDLLYFARTGDKGEFNALKEELCKREKITVQELLAVAKDDLSGNGVLHMAAANGYDGMFEQSSVFLKRSDRFRIWRCIRGVD
jgi:hypothetical protein